MRTMLRIVQLDGVPVWRVQRFMPEQWWRKAYWKDEKRHSSQGKVFRTPNITSEFEAKAIYEERQQYYKMRESERDDKWVVVKGDIT